MNGLAARSSTVTPPPTPAEAARASPTTEFDRPADVVEAFDLTKQEKVEVLDQWEADAKALQTATDEGMSGGQRPRLDEIKAAQTELAAKTSTAGDKVDPKVPNLPIVVTADSARGALGANETTMGDTLLPMLVGGLVLIVVGLLVVRFIG